MTQFMYINPTMKNPKTGENIREAEMSRLQQMKADVFEVIGLEMTVPELAELCDKNIDPQHTDGNATQCCAKEVFEKAPQHLGWIKGKDSEKVVFVTNRVDVDSVAAYVLADRYLQGVDLGSKENIEKINEHDAFQGAPWSGPKSIEEAFDPENKVAALASSVKVFMVTPQNIDDVKSFVDTGEVNETVMNNYRTVQKGIIDRVKSGEIKAEVEGGVAYVETTLPCATNVGYSMAPVVVAINPAMKQGPQGEPFRKVSICQHEAGYVDLNAVKETLNTQEAGWGGSPTFIGSKQGENSGVSTSDIKKTVYANLTPDYKKEATSFSIESQEISYKSEDTDYGDDTSVDAEYRILMNANIWGRKFKLDTIFETHSLIDWSGSATYLPSRHNVITLIVDGKTYPGPDLSPESKKINDLSARQLLEKDDLEKLANQKDFSAKDVELLGHNLWERSKLPEQMRDFSTFNDLQKRMLAAPLGDFGRAFDFFWEAYEASKSMAAKTQDEKEKSQAQNRVERLENEIVTLMRDTDNEKYTEMYYKMKRVGVRAHFAKKLSNQIDKDLCNSYLGKQRNRLALRIDEATGKNLTEKKLPRSMKKLEKAISDKLFGKNRE